MASEVEQTSLVGEHVGGEESSQVEHVTIEKRNLLNVIKLTVKMLIEITMKSAQPLDDTSNELTQFFIALERCLRHRLRGKDSTSICKLVLASIILKLIMPHPSDEVEYKCTMSDNMLQSLLFSSLHCIKSNR